MRHIDVTITGSGRWEYLIKTVQSFKKRVHSKLPFRFFVSDDFGYKRVNRKDKSINITREQIVKSKLFKNWYFPEQQDYGECVKWLFGQVTSPFFFHLQDDWTFLVDVDLDRLIELMLKKKTVNQIRFNKRKTRSRLKAEGWNKLGKLLKCDTVVDGIPLVLAPYWAMHPSINRTAFVKNVPLPSAKQDRSFKPEKWERYWLQNVFYKIDRRDLREVAKKAGTYIYGCIGDPARIFHIGVERALKHRRRNSD